MEDLKQKILEAWDNRDLLQEKETIEAIRTVISILVSGELRCAEPTTECLQVYELVKIVFVLYFPILNMETM